MLASRNNSPKIGYHRGKKTLSGTWIIKSERAKEFAHLFLKGSTKLIHRNLIRSKQYLPKMKLSLAATILCLVGNVPSNDAQSDPGDFCYDSKGKLKGKSGPLLDADFAPTGKKEEPIRSRLDRRGEPGCPCSYVSHTVPTLKT